MQKYLTEFFSFLLLLAYFTLFIILPFEVFKFGLHSEIFPALDLIIIYYFTTYRKMEVWQLFITGFALDPFYGMPIGTNSLILMLANFLLIYFGKGLSLKKYIINVSIFAAYGFIVILLRYIAMTITGSYGMEGYSIYFYFLTTIFSYPAVKILIDKPLRVFYKYAG
jgi:cell shape-determining protein MreD